LAGPGEIEFSVPEQSSAPEEEEHSVANEQVGTEQQVSSDMPFEEIASQGLEYAKMAGW
jgi:hypothetical protein